MDVVLVTHIQIFSEWLGEQKVGIYHDEIYGRKKGSQPNWWDPKLGSSTSKQQWDQLAQAVAAPAGDI